MGTPWTSHWESGNAQNHLKLAAFSSDPFSSLARTRMKGSGMHRRLTTFSSQNCCHHAQSMVPGAGSFGFTVPVSTNDGCNLSFVAKVKMKSIRRAFTFTYPLPNPVV